MWLSVQKLNLNLKEWDMTKAELIAKLAKDLEISKRKQMQR